MKQLLITFLKYLLGLLEPKIVLPTARLNHRKAVEAIMAQSAKSRANFISMLVDALNAEEKSKQLDKNQ